MLGPALVIALFAAKVADLPPGAVMRLGDSRWRAGGEVRHLQFSADGKTLNVWAVGHGTSVRSLAWDATTGHPLPAPTDRAMPDVPEGSTPAVRLTDDRVVTAGPGNAGRVWDATTARQLAQLTGHTRNVTAVALSVDGRLLATGDTAGLVRTWDAKTFRPTITPHGHTAPVRSIRVSADGSRAVTHGADGSARVWDLASGKELVSLRTAGPVDLTPDGLGVVVWANGAVVVRDVLTQLESLPASPPASPVPALGELFGHWGACFATSDCGRTIAVPGSRGIELYEVATDQRRRTVPATAGPRHAIAFTPDGTRLLTAGNDHTVLVWDVRPQSMPLPPEVRRETDAAKLWSRMCVGKAEESYLALARLAIEPDAAVGTARMRMKPATADHPDTDQQRLADARAIELLESLRTPEARDFLKELAKGHATAFRTQEAKRAVERLEKTGYHPK